MPKRMTMKVELTDAQRELLEPMFQAVRDANKLGAVQGQARLIVERCPYCHGKAPGWSGASLWRGWRMSVDAKQYHCREAAVED